jgi:hypothetical protein
VTAHWETAVFEVSPKNDLDMRLRVSFGYPCKLKPKGSEILHDMFCSKLDANGESTHNPLHECMSAVLQELNDNNVIAWVTAHKKGDF